MNKEEFDEQIKNAYNSMTEEEKKNMFELFGKVLPSFKIIEICNKFGDTMQVFMKKTHYIQDEELIRKACNMVEQFDNVLTSFNNEYLGGIKIEE